MNRLAMKEMERDNTQTCIAAFMDLIADHVRGLGAQWFATTTVRSRGRDLTHFAGWCSTRGITHPAAISLAILERYRQSLFEARKADGGPLGWGAQAHKLTAVKQFLRWAARMKHVPFDAGAALDLPRRPQHLPRSILSAREVEQVLALPDIMDPMGVRDRAIMEALYSTGVRRQELTRIMLQDIDMGRGVVFIREGKGRKDRVVPIGDRALTWINRYSRDVRPSSVKAPDPGNLFLSRRGRPLRCNRLTELVHGYIVRANIGKIGSCHIFRHTTATLMLEGGADIRYIQAMLGHAQLSTTALYTRVSIAQLKAVHERTHPARREGGNEEVRVGASVSIL